MRKFLLAAVAAALITTGAHAQNIGPGPVILGTTPVPCGTTGQLQYNNAGTCGAVAEGTAGQVLTSQGTGLPPVASNRETFIAGTLLSANFNSTSDQAIALVGPPSGPWFVDAIFITNCPDAMGNVKGTFYTGANKTGVLFSQTSSTSAFTTITSATTVAALTAYTTGASVAGVSNSYYTTSAQTIYLSLSTAEGATATCDIYVEGKAL